MDGIHDLGGKHGFGKIDPAELAPDVPVFHAPWEAKVFSMVQAASAAGAWRNTDQFRHGVERIDPVSYLADGYYGRWLGGIETLLVEAGILDSAEIEERLMALGGDPSVRVAARPGRSEIVDWPEAKGARRSVGDPAFRVGHQVKTATKVKPGHTRLPAYARGKTGEVISLQGGWVFPDTNAHGLGEHPQHLYTVAFTNRELWGEANENTTVHLDLFESYLTKANT